MDWLNLPPLTSLRAFAAVAETGSFSKAGGQLNVTHAAVSQQVKSLEAHLDTSLVVRDGRGIRLTSTGAELARNLDAGFSTIQKGVETLTGVDALRPVQVTMSPVFAVKWLMPRIADFQIRYPEITLLLNPTGQFVDIKPGGMDVAIRYCRQDEISSDHDQIASFDLAVVGAPSVFGNTKITDPAQLVHFPWFQELGTNEVTDWFSRHGVILDRPLMISHMPGHMILEGICNGEGITYSSRQWVGNEIQSGELIELFPEETAGYFYILTQQDTLRPPVRTFVTWLREQAEIYREMRR
jgi:LysR family transcriptional regulator, glycine cleavage system transcriptional activator